MLNNKSHLETEAEVAGLNCVFNDRGSLIILKYQYYVAASPSAPLHRPVAPKSPEMLPRFKYPPHHLNPYPACIPAPPHNTRVLFMNCPCSIFCTTLFLPGS